MFQSLRGLAIVECTSVSSYPYIGYRDGPSTKIIGPYA